MCVYAWVEGVGLSAVFPGCKVPTRHMVESRQSGWHTHTHTLTHTPFSLTALLNHLAEAGAQKSAYARFAVGLMRRWIAPMAPDTCHGPTRSVSACRGTDRLHL